VNLIALLTACSFNISNDLMLPLIHLESGYNPYAIGVVNGSIKQPVSFLEFVDSINNLDSQNKNYSVGLGQINIKNLNRFNISVIEAIDPCTNIKLSSVILKDCYIKYGDIGKALSCYYSGNEKTGFKNDFKNSYIERFLNSYSNKQKDVVINFDYESFNKLKNQVAAINTPQKTVINKKNIKAKNENSRHYKFSNNEKTTLTFNKKINLN